MARVITSFHDERYPDDDGWNIASTGKVSAVFFSNALQVWAIAQDRSVTVSEAATAFNVGSDLIRQAIKANDYLLIEGDVIEHDGY